MSYENFNQETKLYINKVIEVYAAIKDKEITKNVYTFLEYQDYTFNKLDKIVLSLIIASFLVNGTVKKFLTYFDDLKLEDFLSFVDLEENEIAKLDDNEKLEFYDKYLKFELIELTKFRNDNLEYISPETIFLTLQNVSLKGINILDYFGRANNFGGLFFSEHLIFKVLEKYILTEANSKKVNKSVITSNQVDYAVAQDSLPHPEFKKESQNKERNNQLTNKEELWKLLDEIKKKFIGQEIAAEDLFYNIVNNQQLAQISNMPDGQRSIIFLDGPTGTGKTAITREITDQLGVPFIATSVTNYSSTGYVGADITDILKQLLVKADGDLDLAQRGIVVLDEFDKITYSGSGGLTMKKAVQQQLLDFLGGGTYSVRKGNGAFDSAEVEFDTSKLTFVCLGALTDLRKSKTIKKSSIGFDKTESEVPTTEYSIKPQDLIDIGLERELVGRLNTYLHTNDYSIQDLLKILKTSTISPIIGFQKWVESFGKKVIIDDEVYEIIAQNAYELNTGARSLQTIMNNIRTSYIKDVVRGFDQVIHLDANKVEEIVRNSTSRKVRL